MSEVAVKKYLVRLSMEERETLEAFVERASDNTIGRTLKKTI